MMGWLLAHTEHREDDLLELYCGIGNFTLPLASRFRRVLATELSKPATEAARWNAEINKVGNVEFARLSAEEMTSAMAGERPTGDSLISTNRSINLIFEHSLSIPPGPG